MFSFFFLVYFPPSLSEGAPSVGARQARQTACCNNYTLCSLAYHFGTKDRSMCLHRSRPGLFYIENGWREMIFAAVELRLRVQIELTV